MKSIGNAAGLRDFNRKMMGLHARVELYKTQMYAFLRQTFYGGSTDVYSYGGINKSSRNGLILDTILRKEMRFNY
jgi:ribosomal protein L5